MRQYFVAAGLVIVATLVWLHVPSERSIENDVVSYDEPLGDVCYVKVILTYPEEYDTAAYRIVLRSKIFDLVSELGNKQPLYMIESHFPDARSGLIMFLVAGTCDLADREITQIFDWVYRHPNFVSEERAPAYEISASMEHEAMYHAPLVDGVPMEAQ